MGFADKVSSPANHGKMSPTLSHEFLLLQKAESSAVKIWAIKRRSLSTEWFGEPLPTSLYEGNVSQGTTQVFLSVLFITSKQLETTNPWCFPYVGDPGQNPDPSRNEPTKTNSAGVLPAASRTHRARPEACDPLKQGFTPALGAHSHHSWIHGFCVDVFSLRVTSLEFPGKLFLHYRK